MTPTRTWQVVCHYGPNDPFKLPLDTEDRQLQVLFDAPGQLALAGSAKRPANPKNPWHTVQHTIDQTFARSGIIPSQTATDFLATAIAAYSADLRIPRYDTFDGWTRDIVLHLAVATPDQWTAAQPLLERLLAFLTGDHWTLMLRPLPNPVEQNTAPNVESGAEALPDDKPTKSTEEIASDGSVAAALVNTDRETPSRVCLFSGGLDSFIGAIDQVERSGATALVGHHGPGQGPTSVAQKRALAAFRRTYSPETAPFTQLWVSPPKIVGASGESEITTRSRSILFLALGLALADGTGARELIVPENGLISLNVPLTPSRIGSMSTRTTHPHVIGLLRRILTAIGLEIAVTLPYRFQTKGEMIRTCANQEAILTGVTATMSCAHPGAQRFAGERRANQHCGYCLPCLIRRAAITSAWEMDPTDYAVPSLRTLDTVDRTHSDRGSDLRACRLALDRYATNLPRLTDVLRAGPLPGTLEDHHAYLGVFQRGVEELRHFLARTT